MRMCANDGLPTSAVRVGGHESIKMQVFATSREQCFDGITEVARVTREGLAFEVWDYDFEGCWVSAPDFAHVPKKAKARLFFECVIPATGLAPM